MRGAKTMAFPLNICSPAVDSSVSGIKWNPTDSAALDNESLNATVESRYQGSCPRTRLEIKENKIVHSDPDKVRCLLASRTLEGAGDLLDRVAQPETQIFLIT